MQQQPGNRNQPKPKEQGGFFEAIGKLLSSIGNWFAGLFGGGKEQASQQPAPGQTPGSAPATGSYSALTSEVKKKVEIKDPVQYSYSVPHGYVSVTQERGAAKPVVHQGYEMSNADFNAMMANPGLSNQVAMQVEKGMAGPMGRKGKSNGLG